MTLKKFEALVKGVLKKLPKEFKNMLENVDVVIEIDLDMDRVKTLGLGAKGRFLGLYQGVPLKDRTHYYGIVMPDKITLYKRNIELECKARRLDLREEIKHVIQHEIAHHFGISDKRLKELSVY